jgi:hypothetical protein
LDDERTRYLPSLELARRAKVSIRGATRFRREVDLLGREPDAQHRVAAVLLVAEVQRRETFDMSAEIPLGAAASVPEPMPEPPAGFETRSHRVLTALLSPAPEECATCRGTPGRIACVLCWGSGTVIRDGTLVAVACEGCAATGAVPCPACGGEGHILRVAARRIDDVHARLRYAYLPEMPFSLEERLAQLMEPRDEPPGCLQIDLGVRRTGGPYRQSEQRDPDFLGFAPGRALDEARAAVTRLRGEGTVVRSDIRAFAWPILWLRYRVGGSRREVALFVQADGSLRAVVG